jgi:hypothetical protein
VRFLAKSTLFSHKIVGWLVRGAGSIPVYRKQDDPALMEKNATMFAAVNQALVGGAAVGLFPEGISHSEPSMVALKTGAARIALGSAALLGTDFPIIPIGLFFRAKSEFRSRAHIIVGERIHWRDLAMRGEDDADAVRELTARIEPALRAITVNLEDWEDAPIVELAEAVYAAEFDLRADPVERVARLRRTTRVLSSLRESGSSEWKSLADELRRHARMLRWFRLSPRGLRVMPGTGAAVGWSLRHAPLALIAASGVWIAGALVFWVPWLATDLAARSAMKKGADLVSTTRVIGGTLIFSAWILVLSFAVTVAWGTRAGIATLLVLPVLALVTLLVRERLAQAMREAMHFFRVSRTSGAQAELRARQRELAQRLHDVWRREVERRIDD